MSGKRANWPKIHKDTGRRRPRLKNKGIHLQEDFPD